MTKRIEAREDRLIEVLRLIGLAGENGIDERRIVGQVERVLRVSSRTAKSYLADLRIRGWARVAYGNAKLQPTGAAELEEAKRLEAKEAAT